MPVVPADHRIAMWEAKVAGEAQSVVMGRVKAIAFAEVQNRFPEIVDMENGVKDVLEEASLPTIMFPPYLCAGRQMYRLKRKFSGGTLLKEVDNIINNWITRGLDEDVLDKIRDTIFTLDAPAP
jgi:hypothetical protein